ncbi:hypothetical protein HK102_001941 [Quaeritorhiza haematococci]|nr:hypothetical protein HK102_001941 [Quaeritorhiza haematococci]
MAVHKTSLASRPVDLFFFLFFGIHAVVAVIIDSQVFLGPNPQVQEAMKSYLEWSEDPFMDPGSPPRPWFQGIVFMELAFQVPSFLYIMYGLLRANENIRTLSLLYCANNISTMFPIFFEIASTTSLMTVGFEAWKKSLVVGEKKKRS